MAFSFLAATAPIGGFLGTASRLAMFDARTAASKRLGAVAAALGEPSRKDGSLPAPIVAPCESRTFSAAARSSSVSSAFGSAFSASAFTPTLASEETSEVAPASHYL